MSPYTYKCYILFNILNLAIQIYYLTEFNVCSIKNLSHLCNYVCPPLLKLSRGVTAMIVVENLLLRSDT